MDHHRKLTHWLLLAGTCAFIAAVTLGYGAQVLDIISHTGLATTEELIWLSTAGQ